jgi:ABC-type Fe3+-hydroxamate transport system substrate-binding protein
VTATLSINRRRVVATLCAAALTTPAPGLAQPVSSESLRVATPDWAILETLLAIGANVVAATELLGFADVAVTPPVPASVSDLGLRGTPNLETLRLAAPELIFNSNFYGRLQDRLALIAPVETHSVYLPGELPYPLAEAMTLALGERLDIAAGAPLVAAARTKLDGLRDRLAHDGRPVIAVNFGDARHLRVFGADSMFGEVLTRLGIENAWSQATSYSAMAPVGIEFLASVPDAWIVVIAPTPVDVAEMMRTSAFWKALPSVKSGRVIQVGPANPYGALPAAMRFADLLTEGFGRARTL